MKIESLIFNQYSQSCIWLLYENETDKNIHILWNDSDFVTANELQSLIHYSLFQTEPMIGLKIAIDKENYKKFSEFLLNSKRHLWNQKLLVKVSSSLFTKHFKAIFSNENDLVIEINKIAKNKLFELFIKKNKILFDQEQLNFVFEYCSNLIDLCLCVFLQECQINLQDWEFVLDVQEKISFSKQFKEQTLLSNAIVQDSVITPINYMILALSNSEKDVILKAMLQFLIINIKQGSRIWEHNWLWKNLIDKMNAKL